MPLEKRTCPIEIKVFPRGHGWTDISWFVPEKMSEPLMLKASYIADNIGDFARALYFLCPNQYAADSAYDIIEEVTFEYDLKTLKRGKMYKLGDKRPSTTYVNFPVKAGFRWDEEPEGSNWTLTRAPSLDPNADIDFIVHVHMELNRDMGDITLQVFDYDFHYHDLCYAVGRALTEVIKDYGLHGYFNSTRDRLDVVHLIFLKAVALNLDDAYDLIYKGNDDGFSSDFSAEMELLLFDM